MSGNGVLTHFFDPPFSLDSLNFLDDFNDNAERGPSDLHGSNDLFPAVHRTKDNDVVAFTEAAPAFLSYIAKELLATRLDDIYEWLWVAGLPMPPRPLHQQLVLSRSLIITEDPELHLVWSKNRIFIKPVPRFLLDPSFWAKHLLCPPHPESVCLPGCAERARLVSSAHGFLFSYAALVAHESDYHIAVENRLIPKEITWTCWKSFTKSLLESHSYLTVSPRYRYGELRIGRLNKVYRFRKGRLLRGYSSVSGFSFYAEFFDDNFGKLAAILGFVLIVLTAMQVGLATDRLLSSKSFQHFSYGFTIFSIVAPIAAVLIIMATFLLIFVGNWVSTARKRYKRFETMGIS